jgi:hypothetical protein
MPHCLQPANHHSPFAPGQSSSQIDTSLYSPDLPQNGQANKVRSAASLLSVGILRQSFHGDPNEPPFGVFPRSEVVSDFSTRGKLLAYLEGGGSFSFIGKPNGFPEP